MSSSTPEVGPLGSHRVSLETVNLTKGSPATWGQAVANWESYLAEKADQMLVFIDRETGEFSAGPYSHRFRQSYTRMQYAKIQGFIEGALAEYDDPRLGILTLSNSSLKPNGEPKPPLDHLSELLGSWQSVYNELYAVMGGRRKSDPWGPMDWAYLFILEPHTDRGRVPGGYAHVHVAIVADGELEADRLESVVSQHLIECPGARGDAHELDDAVVVRPAHELNNPGAYLWKYLGKSWDVEQMDDYEKRFAALLKESGRRRLRASDNAQEWMQPEDDGSAGGRYIFAGVGDSRAVQELLEYDDLESFRVAHEMGVQDWLARREYAEFDEGVAWGDTEDVSHEEYERYGYSEGRSMRILGDGPDGDRPPPLF